MNFKEYLQEAKKEQITSSSASFGKEVVDKGREDDAIMALMDIVSDIENKIKGQTVSISANLKDWNQILDRGDKQGAMMVLQDLFEAKELEYGTIISLKNPHGANDTKLEFTGMDRGKARWLWNSDFGGQNSVYFLSSIDNKKQISKDFRKAWDRANIV